MFLQGPYATRNIKISRKISCSLYNIANVVYFDNFLYEEKRFKLFFFVEKYSHLYVFSMLNKISKRYYF